MNENISFEECIKLAEKADTINLYKKALSLTTIPLIKWEICYKLGHIYKKNNEINNAVYNWMEAYEYYPEKINNLYEIIRYYREIGNNKISLLYYKIVENIKKKNNSNIDLKLLSLLDYEYSIIASYNGIKNIGLQIINILNYSNEAYIIKNLFTNMKFYKNILVPIQSINLSETLHYNITEEIKIKFVSSSSSIIKNINNNYIMNIRYVNYMINSYGGYYDCGDKLVTINKYLELDDNFNILDNKILNCEYNNNRFIGIEDIRLFYDKKNEKIIFNGCGCYNNGNIGILIGDYDSLNLDKLNKIELKSSFSNNYCEKNWVYTNYEDEIHIIYEWYPLNICKINKDTNMIESYKIYKDFDMIFKFIRGSTNGVEFLNNNNLEIWFIVHLVSEESPRHYYHMIIIFNSKMELLRYSAPFKFQNECIEYCIGLVVEQDRIICTYSAWDRSTIIGIYDKKYIDDIIENKV